VLQQLGADVLKHRQGAARSGYRRLAAGDPAPAERLRVAQPEEVGPIDFLCSDVICYPARLLRAGRNLAGERPGPQFHLHDQVPGRNRS